MSNLNDEQLLSELKKRFDQNNKSIIELQQLNNELKLVNKKLEDSEALKSHFISHITNEIVNPFTSILGLSENILKVEKENWKKVISMVALIHSEAFNLDFQLKNIFIAAKMEAGEIALEIMNVDLRPLVMNVIDKFKIETRKKNISIHLKFNMDAGKDEPICFRTDPEKLNLILSNLLSNAVKFSNNKQNINLVVSKSKERINFEIQDFGEGIPDENQKIIFDRFKRINDTINSLNSGQGLGLSITKSLLDMLEGTIELKSEKGKGTIFYISIPEVQSKGIEGFSSEGVDFLFDEEKI